MRPLAAAGLALALAAAPAAQAHAAEGSVAGAAVNHFADQDAADFSKQIEQDLGAHGARLAMVFRSGRPRADLPDGIEYTHGAFWIYRSVTTDDGRTVHGYAVYNLYAGDGKGWPKTVSRLVQDWPLDFVSGSAEDDVAVIIPEPALQQRLLEVIDSPAYEALHNPAFSLVSNPLEDRYQNCNTFMLNVLAAAIWDTEDPDRIQANLHAWFKPAIVHTDPLTRLFGPMFDSRLRTGDQHGAVQTTTYRSLADFLGAYDLLQVTYKLSYAPQPDLRQASQ